MPLCWPACRPARLTGTGQFSMTKGCSCQCLFCVSCGIGGNDTSSWKLHIWMTSITLAVCYNPSLTVVLLASEQWHWRCFTEEESPMYNELLQISDEHERFIHVCKRSVQVSLEGDHRSQEFECCWARLKFMMVVEYEAHVGARMLQLMMSEEPPLMH